MANSEKDIVNRLQAGQSELDTEVTRDLWANLSGQLPPEATSPIISWWNYSRILVLLSSIVITGSLLWVFASSNPDGALPTASASTTAPVNPAAAASATENTLASNSAPQVEEVKNSPSVAVDPIDLNASASPMTVSAAVPEKRALSHSIWGLASAPKNKQGLVSGELSPGFPRLSLEEESSSLVGSDKASGKPNSLGQYSNPPNSFLRPRKKRIAPGRAENEGFISGNIGRNLAPAVRLLPPLAIRLNDAFSPAINRPIISVEAESKQSSTTFEKGRNRLSVGLLTGSNYLANSFSGNEGERQVSALNQAVSGAAGQQFDLSITYPIGRGFFLQSGLGFTRTHTILDYRAEFETIAPHPSFPDQFTRAVGEYRVAHNNHSSWLSLPIAVGFERALGRFSLGVSGGVRINRSLSFKGKTLLPTGFAGTADLSTELVPWHVSYLLQPRLSLPLSRDGRWSVQLLGRVEHLNFGTSSRSNTSRSGWLYGGSFGVTYR